MFSVSLNNVRKQILLLWVEENRFKVSRKELCKYHKFHNDLTKLQWQSVRSRDLQEFEGKELLACACNQEEEARTTASVVRLSCSHIPAENKMSPKRGHFLLNGGFLHLHIDPGDPLFPALEGFDAISTSNSSHLPALLRNILAHIWPSILRACRHRSPYRLVVHGHAVI